MNDVETRVELARLDERIKALAREIERSEHAHERALQVAANELARRLDLLNHAHEEAVQVQGTYVPRELFEASWRENDTRLKSLEGDARELKGRSRIPDLITAAVVATVVAAIVAVASGLISH